MLTFIAFSNNMFGNSKIFPIFAIGDQLIYDRRCNGLHIS